MYKYIFWLGSNSDLSRLEIVNVLARNAIPYQLIAAQDQFIIIESKKKLSDNFIDRLGGIERIGTVIGQQKVAWTAPAIGALLSPTEKKFMVGLSKLALPDMDLGRIARDLKKDSRQRGLKLNYLVPSGKSVRLNAAQVIFNGLCKAPNAELTFWQDDDVYFMAKTEQIQDIQAYERRDTMRPQRDARVGLLPPKLAQIMLNLVPGMVPGEIVYDPFCGMGTLLQEGWLMGQRMIGSDNSERMIEASKSNLEWVASRFEMSKELFPTLFVHDITRPIPADRNLSCDAIVTEPHLGPPLNKSLTQEEAAKHQLTLRVLYRGLFTNVRTILKENGWIVMVLPAIVITEGRHRSFKLFPREFIDEVESIGYSCKQLGASNKGIVYARPDALVAREITVWQKK